MDYPVYIDGRECGSVSVTKTGLYTRFSADCTMKNGIVRLYIYGGGKTAYLGTLSPCNGRLRLERRFSPSEMRRFPTTVEYAANEKIEGAAKEAAVPDESLLWFRTESGSLTAFDGEKSLIALPCSDSLKNGRRIEIEGNSYIVFVAKRNLQ